VKENIPFCRRRNAHGATLIPIISIATSRMLVVYIFHLLVACIAVTYLFCTWGTESPVKENTPLCRRRNAYGASIIAMISVATGIV